LTTPFAVSGSSPPAYLPLAIIFIHVGARQKQLSA
jgi:hypothetical protein